ncbi:MULTISPECIES: hypothetical protein [Stutzerimonas]|uniref:Secreted protein n=1 Tax=Stutzerimonas zhaodongensis TaxID=1176257 RepID=A0ABX8J3P8_9GAMM|nr:hypothetical protein [Stutzerimonas zhaodongensis]QWV19449.1 hypothetical protein KQ248_22730 [Stutzerimonas zhaodongensis]
MLQTGALYFTFTLVAIAIAASVGSARGYKRAKQEMQEALDRYRQDVEHGYPNGYHNKGLEQIIQNVIHNG